MNGNLENCISRSLSEVVNQALANGTTVNLTRATQTISAPTSPNTSTVGTANTPMSFTINECAQILQDRLSSFTDFEATTDTVWNDISDTQKSMTAVEQVARDILAAESQFSTQLDQTVDFFQNNTDRAGQLADWVDGEKVIRNQLTDLYTALDKKVRDDSQQVVLTVSSVRDALRKMQVVHDHATKVLTAVGDAETQMYEWAFNVSQKINSHTVSLVAVAQTLQYRKTQVSAVKDANVNLNWIVSQLVTAHGADKLAELNLQYEAGNLVTPQGLAQGPNSTSVAVNASSSAVAPVATSI